MATGIHSTDPLYARHPQVKTRNLAGIIAAAALLGSLPSRTGDTKPIRKCRLKDCTRMTSHNGGYCCPKHCRLDRERNRSKP